MSTLPIKYNDSVVLIDTKQDGYGDNTISHVKLVKALFNMGSSQSQSNYVETLGTDANVYLDIDNKFVQDYATRLEGMYIIANPYGGSNSEQWYKISSVSVGQDKLLSNKIDNIHCNLSKCDALDGEL